MEHAIVHSDLLKEDIKPRALMSRFLDLVATYNRTHLSIDKLVLGACPACASKSVTNAFSKLNLQYFSCDACQTIYLNPRPSQAELQKYFREAEARQFWLQEIWGHTAQIRRSKILDPFLDWAQLFIEQHFSGAPISVAELFPTHWGLLEVWKEKKWRGCYSLVEPYFSQDFCPFNLQSLCLPFDTKERFDVICLPDTLAWVQNPKEILQWVVEHLNPGGFCFLTTIFSTGLDVIVLKGLSSYFVPPERLNLFSLFALQTMIAQFPMEVLEFSTPGVLDTRNIYEALLRGDIVLPENIHHLLVSQDKDLVLESFQEFLQTHRLSSQGRIVLQKGF